MTTMCAIYARKSTEQSVADEQKSVTRQIESAKAYAARKGWAVRDAHVFVDDGISGAEFSARPGFVRLMTALKPKPPFQVLVMSEESRLGRETIEVSYAIKQLVTAGVRIFLYLTDTERTIDSPIEKAMLALQTMADEMERVKARTRTTDAMTRKARNGHVCGGKVFGYRNHEVLGIDGKRLHVSREIEPREAAIVKRIFELCTAGKGVKAIAKTLNADGAPSPRAQQGRHQSWAPSSVRAALHRDLYRGITIWNKTKQSDSWGQRAWTTRPEHDWVKLDTPATRIVSDDLWERAHARLTNAKAVYMRSNDGRLWGRPPSGVASKYLLSGLMRCASCGSSLTVRSSCHGKKRAYYFICSGFDHRGSTVCQNNVPLPMADADDAILERFRKYVLDPAIVTGAIEDAIAELRPAADAVAATREALLADLRRVETEQGRYAAAIAAAPDVAILVDALRDREAQRRKLEQDLAALDGTQAVSGIDVAAVEDDLREQVEQWRAFLDRQIPIARQMVSKLLQGERISWTPDRAAGLYRFNGAAVLDALVDGVLDLRKGSRPQRDSNPCFGLERATS